MVYKIALDAGHSESTWEKTHGKGVLYDGGKVFEEHWFNAAVAKYAKELAEARGIEVILTQPLLNENEVSLSERTRIAKDKKADLLISFHADANGNKSARGHWAFYWYTHEPSKKLAYLWDKYADKILPHMDRNVVESKTGTWTNFHMCREPVKYGIPSILAEHAFMTNSDDLKLLLDDGFRRKCAEVAIRAACEFLGVNYDKVIRVEVPIKINGSIAGTGVIINDRTRIPIRKLAEYLGSKVHWDSKTGNIYIDSVLISQEDFLLIDDVNNVPLRKFSEILGVKVDWDNIKREVLITKSQ